MNDAHAEPSGGTGKLSPNPTYTYIHIHTYIQRAKRCTVTGDRQGEKGHRGRSKETHTRKERTCIPRRAGGKWTSTDSRSLGSALKQVCAKAFKAMLSV